MHQIVTGIATVENRIHSFFHNQSLGQFLRQNNLRKEKGVCLDTLFQFLLFFAFTGKNLFRLLESQDSPAGIGKDTAYRLLNSATASGRRFLLLLSTRVIVQRLLPLTGEATTKVLIADDTLYSRDRSKRVELLARVHDHNTGRYVRGFRMLTLGWSDGNSLVPMMLSMLSSAKEGNRLAPMRDGIDKRTNGYKRRQESMKKSTDLLVDMVAHATMVCRRYTMLELAKRTSADPRTLGNLFHAVCDELRQIIYTEALALLVKLLEETLNSVTGLCKEQVQRLIERFVETLPRAFRE
jgi:hypothetical protein